MGGSEFVFNYVDGLHYKCDKISLNRVRSYIDFPEWIKTRKTTITPKNNGNICLCTVTFALNHKIGKT